MAARTGQGWPWVVVALVATLAPEPALAIPVFARIYDKPCSACHTIYPQLNPAGEHFRAKGLHGMEPRIKPIRIAPGFEVPGTLPIAFSLAVGEDVSRAYIPYVPDSTQDHLNLEYAAVLAGGELGPHLAFLADYAPAYSIPQTGDLHTNHNLGLGFLQAHAEPGGWLMNLRAGLIELPVGTSPRVHRLPAAAPSALAIMDQKNLTFIPSVLAVQRGTVVEFTNSDDVQHNVFTPSATAGRFNLGTYNRGETRSVTLGQSGDAVILCNIHMEMEAHIVVVDGPYFAVADAAGVFRIADVAPGSYTLKLWRRGWLAQTRAVEVGGEALRVEVEQ